MRWFRLSLLSLLLLSSFIAGALTPDGSFGSRERAAARKCIPRSECCRVCSKGKACGNSCIKATYTCHKGRGCACDSDEVC